ncbi:MAG: hypothetical protein V3V49_15200 [Candidatus Krumholzibacteria bacterium]
MTELQVGDLLGQEIFAEGRWTDLSGHSQTWTASDLDDMEGNAKKVTINAFLKLFHVDKKTHQRIASMFKIGDVENIRHVGKKLVADFKRVPKKVLDLMQIGAFGKPSAEIRPTFFDEGLQKQFKNVVSAVGVLSAQHPAVTTLTEFRDLFGGAQPEALVFAESDDWRDTFREGALNENVVLCFYGATHEPLPKEGGILMSELGAMGFSKAEIPEDIQRYCHDNDMALDADSVRLDKKTRELMDANPLLTYATASDKAVVILQRERANFYMG